MYVHVYFAQSLAGDIARGTSRGVMEIAGVGREAEAVWKGPPWDIGQRGLQVPGAQQGKGQSAGPLSFWLVTRHHEVRSKCTSYHVNTYEVCTYEYVHTTLFIIQATCPYSPFSPNVVIPQLSLISLRRK